MLETKLLDKANYRPIFPKVFNLDPKVFTRPIFPNICNYHSYVATSVLCVTLNGQIHTRSMGYFVDVIRGHERY